MRPTTLTVTPSHWRGTAQRGGVTAKGSRDTEAEETLRHAVGQNSRDAVPPARPRGRDAVVTARSHEAAAAARHLAFRFYQIEGHNSRKVNVVREGQGHTSKSS